MDSGLRLFSEHGYQNTTVQDIIDDVGISFGAFYQYFRDRADLVRALLEDHVARRQAEENSGQWQADEGLEGVHRVVSGFVNWYSANADFAAVWEQVCHVDEELAEVRRDLGRQMTERVEAELLRGSGAGTTRPFDPEEAALAARALNGMVDRFCYVSYVFDIPEGGAPDPSAASRILTDLWARGIGLAET